MKETPRMIIADYLLRVCGMTLHEDTAADIAYDAWEETKRSMKDEVVTETETQEGTQEIPQETT